MKKYLLLAAITLPCLCVAQINVDTIPKKVNVIEIETGLSMEDNFTRAAQVLAEKSWEIAQMHKEIGQLVTGIITIKSVKHKFNILAKEGTIRLAGDFTMELMNLNTLAASDLGYSKITNFGMKGSAGKKSFQNLVDLAQSLAPPNSKIRFLTTN